MEIPIACPSCKYLYKVPASYAGRGVVCPQCGNPIRIPGKPTGVAPEPGGPPGPEMTRSCPFCAETIKSAARKCPHCGEILDPDLARQRAARRFGYGSTPEKVLQRKARDAFLLSLVGLSCCLVASVIGMVSAMDVNQKLTSMGKPRDGLATAAIVLGIVAIALQVIGFIVVITTNATEGAGGGVGW